MLSVEQKRNVQMTVTRLRKLRNIINICGKTMNIQKQDLACYFLRSNFRKSSLDLGLLVVATGAAPLADCPPGGFFLSSAVGIIDDSFNLASLE